MLLFLGDEDIFIKNKRDEPKAHLSVRSKSIEPRFLFLITKITAPTITTATTTITTMPTTPIPFEDSASDDEVLLSPFDLGCIF